MDSWDSEDFSFKRDLKSKWDDEDVEEESTLESWDQEPEEAETKSNGVVQPKKLNNKKVEELDKILAQKLCEESDLNLAKEIFGVKEKKLETKEDYEKLASGLSRMVEEAERNSNFFQFVDEIVGNLCSHLSSGEVKKIGMKLNNLHIQKVNAERGEKKKPKSKAKAKLRVDDNDMYDFCDEFI